MRIGEFSGQYRFLSNFWPCVVTFDGAVYSSVEHAYQAAKTSDVGQREGIRNAVKAGDAKRLGRRVNMRADWDKVKQSVMLDLVRQKFQEPALRHQLKETGDAELVEGNWWGDTYWGVCRGKGENHLGKILMQVRGEQ